MLHHTPNTAKINEQLPNSISEAAIHNLLKIGLLGLNYQYCVINMFKQFYPLVNAQLMLQIKTKPIFSFKTILFYANLRIILSEFSASESAGLQPQRLKSVYLQDRDNIGRSTTFSPQTFLGASAMRLRDHHSSERRLFEFQTDLQSLDFWSRMP